MQTTRDSREEKHSGGKTCSYTFLLQVKGGNIVLSRGERLLQTNPLIGQEVQLPSSDWTRAT